MTAYFGDLEFDEGSQTRARSITWRVRVVSGLGLIQPGFRSVRAVSRGWWTVAPSPLSGSEHGQTDATMSWARRRLRDLRSRQRSPLSSASGPVRQAWCHPLFCPSGKTEVDPLRRAKHKNRERRVSAKAASAG